METRGQRQQALEFTKEIANDNPEIEEGGRTWCKYCQADMPDEGHQVDCVWIMANEIVNPPKEPVDQEMQDVWDFMVQLKTYRSYPDPISMTIQTMTANLGAQTMERIEQAVTKRFGMVFPGVFNN